MENKQFKPFDKVLVRDFYDGDGRWVCDIYSNEAGGHYGTIGKGYFESKYIIPFEGNEHLLGTTDNPEDVKEEVKLEEGDFCFFAYNADCPNSYWFYGYLTGLEKELFRTIGHQPAFAIPFKEFDPYNMEETRKHILRVSNGRVVRYQWEDPNEF